MCPCRRAFKGLTSNAEWAPKNRGTANCTGGQIGTSGFKSARASDRARGRSANPAVQVDTYGGGRIHGQHQPGNKWRRLLPSETLSPLLLATSSFAASAPTLRLPPG